MNKNTHSKRKFQSRYDDEDTMKIISIQKQRKEATIMALLDIQTCNFCRTYNVLLLIYILFFISYFLC